MPPDSRINLERIDIRLKPIDKEILRVLLEGRCTPGHLSNEIGEKTSWISKRLKILVEDAEAVSRVDRGLYELEDDFIEPGGIHERQE